MKEENDQILLQGVAVCVSCEHTFKAVAPTGVEWIQCQSCRLMKAKWFHHISPPTDSVFACVCGNPLFFITEEGVFCPNCGHNMNGDLDFGD